MKKLRQLIDSLWYPLSAFSVAMFLLSNYDMRFLLYSAIFLLYGLIADIKLDEGD